MSVTKVDSSSKHSLSSLSEEFQLFILTYCYPYLYSRQNLNNTSADHWENLGTGLCGRFVLIYFYAKTKGEGPERGMFVLDIDNKYILFASYTVSAASLSLRCRVVASTYEQLSCISSKVPFLYVYAFV